MYQRTFLMQDTKHHSWSYSRISYVGRLKLFILEFSQTRQNYNSYSAVIDTCSIVPSQSFSINFLVKKSSYKKVYPDVWERDHWSIQANNNKGH